MKKFFSFLICLTLLLCFPVCALGNNISVSTCQDSNIIWVEGNVDPEYGGQNVNILLVGKDENLSAISDASKVGHIGFTTVDSSGHYSYKFSFDGASHDYKVLTKIGDFDILSSEIDVTESKILKIELNLVNKDKTAFVLGDEQYEIKTFIDNKFSKGKRVDLISAFYGAGDKLIKVETINDFEISFDKNGVFSVENLFSGIPEETEKIMLMVWENGKMKPLGNASEYSYLKNPNKEFYVSPDGSDFNDGSFDKPLKTLIGARNAVRQYIKTKGLPAGGITVLFKGGTYPVNLSIDFTEEDSGTENSPVVYKAYDNEEVIFSGGIGISGNEFSRVTDESILSRLPDEAENNIYCVNLKNYGIYDYGDNVIFNHSVADRVPGVEAFYNGAPMVTARYPNIDPNTGLQQYINVNTVVNKGEYGNENPPVFTYTDEFIENTDDYTDVIIEGWFPTGYDYCGSEIASVDKETNTVSLLRVNEYGVGPNNRYCISNMLEALDTQNEYYIDKKTGMLYVYSNDINSATISLSLFGEKMKDTVIRTTDASNIRFEGLTMELCRTSGISIYGGENVVVDNCTIRNMGLKGVIIGANVVNGTTRTVNGLNSSATGSFYNKDFKRAFNHGIINTSVYNTGDGAITVAGGDRKNLVPSNHYVRNCVFHDNGRFHKSKAIAEIYGVGINVSNCDFYNAACGGIAFGGNDIIIEYNDFKNITNDCVDFGIIYSCTFGAEIQAGSEIRYNYFHDVPNKTYEKGDIYAEGTIMRVAVYNDYCNPFLEVHHNLFENLPIGIFNGSGAENNWKNNVFVNVNKPMFIQWNNILWTAITGGNNLENMFDCYSTREYRMFNVESGIWKQKYPEVAEAKAKMIERGKDAVYPSSTISDNYCIFLTEESQAVLERLSKVPQLDENGEMKVLEYDSKSGTPLFGFLDKMTTVQYHRVMDQNKYLTLENNVYTTEDIVDDSIAKNNIDLSEIGAGK